MSSSRRTKGQIKRPRFCLKSDSQVFKKVSDSSTTSLWLIRKTDTDLISDLLAVSEFHPSCWTSRLSFRWNGETLEELSHDLQSHGEEEKPPNRSNLKVFGIAPRKEKQLRGWAVRRVHGHVVFSGESCSYGFERWKGEIRQPRWLILPHSSDPARKNDPCTLLHYKLS